MIHAWVIQLVQYDSIEWNSWSKGEIDYPVDLSGGQLACLHLKHRCYPNIHSGDYQAMSSSEGSCGLAEQRDGRSHPRVYIHVGNAARPEKFSSLGGLLLWPRTLKMPKVGGASESRSISAPRNGFVWGLVAPDHLRLRGGH